MYAMKLDLVLKRMIFNLMTELKIELPPPRKKRRNYGRILKSFHFHFCLAIVKF